MPQEIYGVEPNSEEYSHEVILSARGRKYGLKLLNGTQSVHIIPPPRQPPVIKLEQNSWHQGRGAEVWTPQAYNFYDSQNAWTSTPNKLHPTLLMQWYTGFRDAEMNMPSPGDTHKWVPLYAGAGSDTNRRYLDVAFTVSATSARERAFVIIRKKGTPTGNLTMEWCDNSAGNPGTVNKTITKVAADLADPYTSYYVEFKPSSVWNVTAAGIGHIKVYGATNDNPNNCWEILCDSAAAGLNSSNGSSWSATTYSPYYRITDADVDQRIFMFPFDGAWYAVTSRADQSTSKLYIHGCRGRATSGNFSTLTDTGSGQYGGAWTTNQWAPTAAYTWKIRIVRGKGQGQVRSIASNTGTVITPTDAFVIQPDSTTEYVIYGGPSWKEITGHGLTWVSAKPAYANGIVYFPQGDSTDIRILQLNYANANDHGFDAEDTSHNRAYFLVPSYDATLGPVMIRANEAATASGVPNGKAISVGVAPTSPAGVPVPFGTDLTFQTSILTGDNTFRITGTYEHQNRRYVAKEDLLYILSGIVPEKVSYGADASPNTLNGVAGCTGMDGQFYLSAEHDVFLISNSTAYPTNLPFNLPSTRSGYVMDMCSVKGWLFAAVDARGTGYSSIMRMSLDNRSWHEQIRGFATGRRIRSVAWLSFEETRPHLAHECAGELLYQEMPLYGTRPIQDSGLAYQHEMVLEFPTMDLLNTDPKFFSFFALDSKNLADAATAAVYGREIALDYLLNNNITGSATGWINAGAFGISPQDKIHLNQGSQYKIRPRLRIESNQASNPPIVENLSLSLFSRTKQASALSLDINAVEEEDVSGEEIWSWLISRILTADVVSVESVFSFMHNQRMVLPAEPNTNITNLDPELGFAGILQLYMEYLPQ